jgi:hypothetical protein
MYGRVLLSTQLDRTDETIDRQIELRSNEGVIVATQSSRRQTKSMHAPS